MTCTQCGASNRPGAKFCSACGTRLALACAQCGSPLEPDARFCAECGAPAATDASRAISTTPASAVSAHTSERRLVSVLFADLVGFTPFAEGRDPEEVRETLSRYFELSSEVIGRYGGTVEKFIGDAVMAVWGAPVAHEDDAERAVRAALELLTAVRRLGPSVSARAGILTGEAAVTMGATNQGMVAGDLVNTASRLQAVAPPDTVLVGEATQRAASDAIAFEPAGDQLLKGKAAPVPAWRAMRVVAQRRGRNRREALEAPFVGREEELALLKSLFHATARESRARLVSVIGPAGIGKTRLAWEFLKYLDGLVEGVWYHDGRSPAYGDGISFWALGEMVRRRAGLLETDDEATTRAKVAEALATHVPDADERRWIEPALLALLGLEAGIGSDRLFGAWRTFFERLADTAPVVMVFEDFHFADSGLLDFVDHLLEWGRGSPIYVVTLSRPELLDRRPDWGAGKRSFVSVHLEPLHEPAMRELLAGLVPGLPEAAIRTVLARADGIPLYAVETVRSLLEDGKLARAGEVYVPVADLADVAVPATLTALIASRLDGLPPADRSIVQDAAVLGQSFTVAGLAAVSNLDEADLSTILRGLVRREILRVEADPRSPERGQHAFVQALIREVAYNTLARSDRKARHLAAARYFESLDSDELAGALAGHYLGAHANASEGPEADALAAQARLALRAAGERAAGLGAHKQALAFFEQARAAARDPLDEAELLGRAGESAAAAGQYERAEALLSDAVALHRERGDRGAVARAVAVLARVLISTYRIEQAKGLLEAAVAESSDLEGDPGVVAVLGQLARCHLLRNEQALAVAAADRALPWAERLDLGAVLADLLVTKGTALGSLGRSVEGVGVIEIGLRLAERLGLGATSLRARLNRGYVLARIDLHAALENDRLGLEEARQNGQRRMEVLAATNAAIEALYVGRFDEAQATLDSLPMDELERADRFLVLARFAQLGAWRGDSIDEPLEELRELAGREPDPSDARHLIEIPATRAFTSGNVAEASAAFRGLPALDYGNSRVFLVLAARAALLDRDAESARDDLERLEAIGIHGAWTDACRTSIRAGIAALEGRPDEAVALYSKALSGLEADGYALDLALTTIEMASLLDPARPEVSAAVSTGRGVLERIGATTLLARLEAATRPSAADMPAAAPA
ncbi:MAG TPA: adenylate/guanylate cyclase domain-containing protein [Candidatus Dormibacteraeota bacterium]|nr:adenylate/guanylate cyclase domain-containing protein [Candidatus Dormibacteraeota bacterium]